MLDDLKERDQLIIQLYYYEELSLKEISEILQISESEFHKFTKNFLKNLEKG